MILTLDAMGGDYAPEETVAGAVMWVQSSEVGILLVGQEEKLRAELVKYDYDGKRIRIVNASQVIGMDESAAALRKKQDSSIVVATRLVREGRADAVISCGSTGAQMAAATLILGRMEGIERPPIVAEVPGMSAQKTLLLDVGANVDCKPQQLVQFALLGSVYASALHGIENPRIGLLSNGEEEGKGNKLSIETAALLQDNKRINFSGNIEGRDLFYDKADVVVCDGFVGNILLKTVEGLARFIAMTCLTELGKMPSLFTALDNSQVGGAPLLGIKGVSIVCHGSSKREAVFNALRIAEQCVTAQMVEKQQSALS
ncbi:MAG: phosphate acyltransferase PlsX [Syntrophomonadaceae bacterium]|nr:phosphate acyltransferase PlsX [Syntrophomonadaceae bacterium]